MLLADQSAGTPERDMLLLGVGGRGEGLGRPEFVMSRCPRRVRLLAISHARCRQAFCGQACLDVSKSNI